MNFLGRIGIDLNLIVAQIVNFAILVFILYKFVYKPIFRKINDDEAKLREAEIKSKKLDEERQVYEAKKKEEEKALHEKSEEVLGQAQEIAKEIRQKSLEKAQVEAKEILQLARVESGYSKKFQKKKAESLSLIFNNKKIYVELENIFFERLMDKIKQVLVKYKNLDNMSLEYAHPLPKEREEKVRSFVTRYIHDGKKIEMKEEKSLIAGYRFLTNKLVIDQNLLYEINNA